MGWGVEKMRADPPKVVEAASALPGAASRTDQYLKQHRRARAISGWCSLQTGNEGVKNISLSISLGSRLTRCCGSPIIATAWFFWITKVSSGR